MTRRIHRNADMTTEYEARHTGLDIIVNHVTHTGKRASPVDQAEMTNVVTRLRGDLQISISLVTSTWFPAERTLVKSLF